MVRARKIPYKFNSFDVARMDLFSFKNLDHQIQIP